MRWPWQDLDERTRQKVQTYTQYKRIATTPEEQHLVMCRRGVAKMAMEDTLPAEPEYILYSALDPATKRTTAERPLEPLDGLPPQQVVPLAVQAFAYQRFLPLRCSRK
jgi:hypothetical protein